jgi:iron complex outermembrane receptor protein
MTNQTIFIRRAGFAPLALGLMLSCATQALAQDETPAPAAPVAPAAQSGADDIIVTARRRDERLIDAPVAITAIGGATLQSYSVTRVTDMATLVPSLIAGKAASGSSASIFLRGVGSTALSAGFDQSVSFVIDGLPMSRGREISLPQFDIKGVEVMKGPQALFFGKNTTAGLISITSNGPGDTFETGIKAGYGFKSLEKYVEGYVSGPVTDTFGARFAARYSNAEGAFRNTADKNSTDALGRAQQRYSSRRGRGESFGGRLTLDWDVTDNFNMELKAGATWLEDGGPTDLVERLCAGGRTTPTNASANADCKINGRSDLATLPVEVVRANYRYAGDNGEMYAKFRSQYGVLTSGLTGGAIDVTSITSYYHFKQEDLNNVAGQGYPATFSQLADFDQFSQEIRFQSKLDGPFNFLSGAFYSHGKFVFNTDAYIFPVPVDPASGTAVTFKRDNGFSHDSLSMFVQGTLEFGQFELAGGARYSAEARKSYQRSLAAHPAFAAAFPAGIVLNDKFNDDDISPEVTLRYKPGADTTLYAAYKRGFKTGGFNLSQSLTPAASIEAGQYGSETAEGGEVGLRTLLLNRALSINVTAYSYTYSDLQVQTFDPATIGLIAGNAGKLRTRGVEADFNWRLIDGFSIRGAAAYNDAKYKSFVGQCYGGQTIAEGCDQQLVGAAYSAQDYSGRTPPKAPKFAGRIGGTFKTPLGDSLNLSLTSDVSYTSRYYFTDTLRPDAIQKGFAKVDASAAISGVDDKWTVSLIGRNLTNRLVATSANDIPFTGGSGTGTTSGIRADMSTFIENPREIVVEVGFKF